MPASDDQSIWPSLSEFRGQHQINRLVRQLDMLWYPPSAVASLALDLGFAVRMVVWCSYFAMNRVSCWPPTRVMGVRSGGGREPPPGGGGSSWSVLDVFVQSRWHAT